MPHFMVVSVIFLKPFLDKTCLFLSNMEPLIHESNHSPRGIILTCLCILIFRAYLHKLFQTFKIKSVLYLALLCFLLQTEARLLHTVDNR